MVKNGRRLIGHGTLKPGIPHRYEFSRLTECFLHAHSDRMIFYSTQSLTSKCWRAIAVFNLARVFKKNPLCGKITTN